MLYLSKWANWHGGAVVEALFQHLRTPNEQIAFCRHMTRAALDLLVLGLHLNKGLGERPKMLVRERPGPRWYVAHRCNRNGLRVILAVPMNDSVLWALSKVRLTDRCYTTVIVAPGMKYIVEHALHDIRKKCMPSIRSIDEYVAFRTLMSGLDAGWSELETTRWLLSRYNLVARRAHAAPSLLIEFLQPANHTHRL